MSEQAPQISLAEAEAMTEGILEDYRKQTLAATKRELELFGDEMQRITRDHAVRTRNAIEADLRDLRAARFRYWIFDAFIGVGLILLTGTFIALGAIGFMKIFTSFSEGR